MRHPLSFQRSLIRSASKTHLTRVTSVKARGQSCEVLTLTLASGPGPAVCGIERRHARTVYGPHLRTSERDHPLYNIRLHADRQGPPTRPPARAEIHPHTCDSLGRRSKWREQGAIMTQA